MGLRCTVEPTLDDAMAAVFQNILATGTPVKSTKGPNSELSGVSFQVEDPRTRLSRSESRGKPFSCLGEFFWYLSRSQDTQFISYYLSHYEGQPDVRGAYGPRLFDWDGTNQIRNVVELLKSKPGTRQAVVQLIDRSDIPNGVEDIPCTCTLQFLNRQGSLHMITHMRSNDAFLGLPHDFFCFTMLQEVLSRELDVELGSYTHMVGSLHLYDEHREKAEQFLQEGFQSTAPIMPPMPQGNPWPAIEQLLVLESEIRRGAEIRHNRLESLDPYWADIARLLIAFRGEKNRDDQSLEKLRREFHCKEYCHFLHLN